MANKRQNQKTLQTIIFIALLLLAALAQHFGLVDFSSNQEDPTASAAAEPLDSSLPQVKVCFIDVGQGDSTLIMAPGANVLIDGGTPANGTTVYNLLQEQGIDQLDYIINTHPHSDHVGGLYRVVKNLGENSVGEVLITRYPDELEPNNQSWPQFLETAKANGAKISAPLPGDQYDLGGGAVLTIVGPTGLYDDMNADSIVCRLDFGDASFLFTGDSTIEALRDMAENGFDLSADVLRVPHHGSSTSTDSVTLRLIGPKAAVISCGADNDYGHPHKEVVSLLQEKRLPCFRTDLQGSIWAATDGRNISFAAQRGQEQPQLLNAA